MASSVGTQYHPIDEDLSLGTPAGAISIEPGIGLVVVVVHAYREDRGGEEIIRIISARAAEKSDVRRYQEQEVD